MFFLNPPQRLGTDLEKADYRPFFTNKGVVTFSYNPFFHAGNIVPAGQFVI